MGASFSAEIAKIVRRPAIWVIVGIWILLNVVFGAVIPDLVYTYSHNMSAHDRQTLVNSMIPRGFVGNSVGGLPLFGGAIVIIAGAMVLGSEYGWGTMPVNFIRRPGRLSVLSGFFLALTALVVVLEIALLGINALDSYLVARHLGLSTAWPGGAEIVRGIWVTLLITLMWTFLGAFLAILARGTTFAIGVGLVYLLVIASIISGFAGSLHVLKQIDNYLPKKNAGALASHFFGSSGSPGVTHDLSMAHATIVLIAYVVGFVVLSGALIKRRDLI